MSAPYYEKLGMGVDELVRCQKCLQLVLASYLEKFGRCRCGSTMVNEIRTLSEAEMDKIRSGEIDFPHRDLFLKEFAPETEGEC